MTPITPEEARDLLDGTTPGPWEVRTSESGDTWLWAPVTDDVYGPRQPFEVVFYNTIEDVTLAAAAPALARTCAGMHAEHRHEVQSVTDGTWHPLTEWAEGEPDRRPWNVTPTRIVRRYVTTEEEIE